MRLKILVMLFIGLAFSVLGQDRKELFNQSYDLLNGMLRDQSPYNFKQAVLSVENAYLDGKLDTVLVNSKIRILRNLAETLTKERALDYNERDKDKVNKWAAVFEIMCDSIPLNIDGKLYQYEPFSYDFEDAFGHNDWTNMFVSKLLASRKGNCHSLPYLYKILTEEMGAEANLALAPNHVYIKHKSLKDGWYNTEMTSGIFPVDAWLMASGYVHIDALTNGVYMKALDKKECVALVLVDLAQAYQRRFPDDTNFIIKCCDTALDAYPNFANALILKAEMYKIEYERENDSEKAKILLAALSKQYANIHQIGYRNMPESMYLNWLASLKLERSKYENNKLSTFKK